MIIDKDGTMKNNINETITFDDLLLVPQYSEILSRKTINLSSELDMNREFELPVISSPMDTVTGATMASAMSKAGGFGIIHRYDSIEKQCDRIRRTNGTKSAAIGVTGDYLDRATALIDSGCDILCVDVAHGHHALMRHALRSLRDTIGYGVHIMAGNVATLQAFNDLADWGAIGLMVLSGMVMLFLAIFYFMNNNSQYITLTVFGFIAISLGYADFKSYRNKSAIGKQRIARHLTNMLAGTIEVITAVLVTNVDIEPVFILWILPTIIITPIIFWWNRKILGVIRAN